MLGAAIPRTVPNPSFPWSSGMDVPILSFEFRYRPCPAGPLCHFWAFSSREPLSSQRFPPLRPQRVVRRPPWSIRMSVSACWNVSTDRPAESADVGWNQVGQGLKLVGAGYVLMIAGTCLGLFLAWPAISGKELSGARALSPSEEQASLVAGLVAVGVATLCSFLLIVAGQWRCLMQAPGNESA